MLLNFQLVLLSFELVTRNSSFTISHSIDRPLQKGKKLKSNWINENELGGNIMTKFVGLRVKTYSYLIDDGSEDKKTKGTKKCVIKRKLELKKIIETV